MLTMSHKNIYLLNRALAALCYLPSDLNIADKRPLQHHNNFSLSVCTNNCSSAFFFFNAKKAPGKGNKKSIKKKAH